MSEFVPIDRAWVNVAVKLQRLQLKPTLDWSEIYSDAQILQEIACGNLDGIPHFCQTCGEPTTDYKTEVECWIDVGVYSQGPVLEESYHCNLCGSELAYWGYGTMEPRV